VVTPPSNPNQTQKPNSNEIKTEREDYLSKNPTPNIAGKVRGPAPTLRPAGINEPLHEYQFVFYLGVEALALVTEINGLSQERDVIEHKIVPIHTDDPGAPILGTGNSEEGSHSTYGLMALVHQLRCTCNVYRYVKDPL
jgi:hypothetical protein